MNRILSLLPQKFNHLHSAWDSVEDGKRTVDNLTTRLMAQESRLSNQETTHEKSMALVAGIKIKLRNFYPQQSNSNYENKKQGPNFFNCGMTGHLKKDCYRCYICKKKGHKSNNCFRKKEGYIGHQPTTNQNKNPLRKGLTASQAITEGEVWTIDSGASDHMSKRRDWFSTFEEFAEPLKTAVGDGKIITAFGKGNINTRPNKMESRNAKIGLLLKQLGQ